MTRKQQTSSLPRRPNDDAQRLREENQRLREENQRLKAGQSLAPTTTARITGKIIGYDKNGIEVSLDGTYYSADQVEDIKKQVMDFSFELHGWMIERYIAPANRLRGAADSIISRVVGVVTASTSENLACELLASAQSALAALLSEIETFNRLCDKELGLTPLDPTIVIDFHDAIVDVRVDVRSGNADTSKLRELAKSKHEIFVKHDEIRRSYLKGKPPALHTLRIRKALIELEEQGITHAREQAATLLKRWQGAAPGSVEAEARDAIKNSKDRAAYIRQLKTRRGKM